MEVTNLKGGYRGLEAAASGEWAGTAEQTRGCRILLEDAF
jgi:hypothetical protein